MYLTTVRRSPVRVNFKSCSGIGTVLMWPPFPEFALGGGEPVANADAKTADSFDSPYSRPQLRAQQSRVARLIGHSAYRRQAQIDGVRSVPFLLQVNPVSQDYGAIEGQARFGAIPLDEVVDGMAVRSLPAHGCEGIEDGGFGLFEIRQCKDPLRRSLLSRFRHERRLLRPSPFLWRRERVK